MYLYSIPLFMMDHLLHNDSVTAPIDMLKNE